MQIGWKLTGKSRDEILAEIVKKFPFGVSAVQMGFDVVRVTFGDPEYEAETEIDSFSSTAASQPDSVSLFSDNSKSILANVGVNVSANVASRKRKSDVAISRIPRPQSRKKKTAQGVHGNLPPVVSDRPTRS